MHNYDEIPFTPEQIDEQIDHIAASTNQQPASSHPQVALVRDLQHISLEYTRARDRIWSRLSDHLVSSKIQSSEDTTQETFARLQKPINVSRHSPMPGSSSFSNVSLLARMVAVLVVALLVGSMLWVFTQMKHQQTVTSSQAQPQHETPVPQYSCPDKSNDHGVLAICTYHEMQLINQSQPFGKQTLTLEAAYADANRVILWLTLAPIVFPTPTPISTNTPRTSRIIPEFETLEGTLTTPQGLHLQDWGGEASLNPATQQQRMVETFVATSVPPSAQTLNLHLVMKLLPVGPEPSYSSSFDFSVPVHKSWRVETNQMVTVNGIPVTLQRVVVSPSQTYLLLSSPKLHSIGTNTAMYSYKLTTSNRTLNLQNFYLYGTNLYTRNGINTYRLDVYEPLFNARGAWTLTISKDEVKGATSDWVFHFTV